ncbi:MAG: sn-glycerol-3-phosphate ABC transporter ATP-binding protein UgpC [Marivivens sp.]|nr:sn-glycerol-3-phosphate ABC transporter ATP-binding protein UgpC [Marivivens sp.]
MALDSASQSGLALEIKTLRKSYGDVDVLHDIEVQMAEGEFLVLVGPSGCGKSTLLNCIAGLEETTGGRLFIGGRDVTEEPPKDRDIAMVFQSYALYPTMTVAENIGFGMKIRRVPKDQAKAKVDEVAKMLQIEQLLSRQPSQLSGGQRQRVAMGRALVRDPKLYLFDEPLSNLDAKLRVEMRAEIKKLHRTTGASIVYVTHDQIEAMTLASRIVVLKDGYVQQIGTPQEIYDTPANTFVADFMGSPPMNLIPAQVTDAGVLIGGQALPLHADGLPSEVIVGIRPEHMIVDPQSPLSITPTLIENTGAECYVSFELNGTPVTARIPGRMDEASNAPIPMRFVTDAMSFFDKESGLRLS